MVALIEKQEKITRAINKKLLTQMYEVKMTLNLGHKCIALHGCQQSAEFVSDAFAAGAGYNQWAEANKLLVLYPQVTSSKIAPLNPLGCWDWWGYTSEDYATREAPQIKMIEATIDAIAGREL